MSKNLRLKTQCAKKFVLKNRGVKQFVLKNQGVKNLWLFDVSPYYKANKLSINFIKKLYIEPCLWDFPDKLLVCEYQAVMLGNEWLAAGLRFH